MRRASGLVLSCCLIVFADAVPGAPSDALDKGLAAIGATRRTFCVDLLYLQSRGGTAGKLPIFDLWFREPVQIPFWEANYRNAALSAEGRVHALFNIAASPTGVIARRDLIPPKPADRYAESAAAPDALRNAILRLDSSVVVPSPKSVPLKIQTAAAMLLFAASDALRWRELAVRVLTTSERETLFQSLLETTRETANNDSTAPQRNPFDELAAGYRHLDLLEKVDRNALTAAGDDLTATLERVIDSLANYLTEERFEFECDTRYGRISLHGGSDDTYNAERDYLLIIDAGGNDRYFSGGASMGADRPLGMLLDCRGNDIYESGGKPAFGAGVLGWGLLWDGAGDDVYRSRGFHSQGCGIAGISILTDGGGNDRYDARGSAQGFGYYGIGILADRSGDDRYDAYVQSQGVGLPQGSGWLIDYSGNDFYTANDSDIVFPSPQTKEHNANMAQGAGYGFRRDYIDGKSEAGGFGILLDGGGDDSYYGGVFAQAVGYWFGIGILDDRGGNDRYRGVWYNQSASAHFGISYLADGGGDDRYTSEMTMAMAAAHDFSASVFVDENGNDEYAPTANAIGRALNCSVALFVEQSGDDRYLRGDFGLSTNEASSGLRAAMPTLALFLDCRGDDCYPANSLRNNRRRAAPVSLKQPVLGGCGWDLRAGELVWRIPLSP